jgi:hypothetical protein
MYAKHGRLNYKEKIDLLTDFAALCLIDFTFTQWFVFSTQLLPPWTKEQYPSSFVHDAKVIYAYSLLTFFASSIDAKIFSVFSPFAHKKSKNTQRAIVPTMDSGLFIDHRRA